MASFQDVSINEMQQVEGGGFWGDLVDAVSQAASVVITTAAMNPSLVAYGLMLL